MGRRRRKNLRLKLVLVVLSMVAFAALPGVFSYTDATIQSLTNINITDSANALVAVTLFDDAGSGLYRFAGSSHYCHLRCGAVTNNIGSNITLGGTNGFEVTPGILEPGATGILYVQASGSGVIEGSLRAEWVSGSAQIDLAVPVLFEEIARPRRTWVTWNGSVGTFVNKLPIPATIRILGAVHRVEPNGTVEFHYTGHPVSILVQIDDEQTEELVVTP